MDSEEAYAVKLADYFKTKSGLSYTIQVFTNIDSFLDYDKRDFTDILIISEVYSDYITDLTNTSQIYILSEGSIDISLTEYSTIYKYQSTENIIRDVMTSYASLAPSNSRISLKTATSNIISVYSPVKRCGKTTFALTMGCLLAQEEKTLYISLEEYSCLSYFTMASHIGDLSDLLYFYKQCPLNLDKKLLALSHSIYKLDYICPTRFSMDLKSLSGQDWCDFINDIAAAGTYQNIILDISDSIPDIFELLSISNIVYFPILDDALSMSKIANFKEVASILGKDSLLKKLYDIRLPLPDISNDSNSFSKLLFGPYGSAISNLINKKPAKEYN